MDDDYSERANRLFAFATAMREDVIEVAVAGPAAGSFAARRSWPAPPVTQRIYGRSCDYRTGSHSTMEDRGALYYPYIHIRDMNWLKGTLLCFPHVYRMVPGRYKIKDEPVARRFKKLRGPHDRPLLNEAWIEKGPAFAAEGQLLRRLKADYPKSGVKLHEKFSLVQARYDCEGREDDFQVYRNKINWRLLEFLEAKGLAWAPRKPDRAHEWVAMHPVMGQAFMSTIAAAIAKHDGLDVVTDSGPVHAALAHRDEEAIYKQLILGDELYKAPKKSAVVNEIIELVVMTRFKLDRVSPEDIARMSRDREGLYALRKELKEMAGRIPSMTNRKRRDEYLQDAANDIIAEWRKDKKNMSKFAREFFGAGMGGNAAKFLEKVAPSVLSGGALGTAGGAVASGGTAAAATVIGGLTVPALIGAGAGLAVGVIIHGVSTAIKVKKQSAKSPYRFLSKIEKAGAVLMVSAPAKTAK